jgi:hypothetical protein
LLAYPNTYINWHFCTTHDKPERAAFAVTRKLNEPEGTSTVSRPQSIPLRLRHGGGFLRWAGILYGRRTPSLSLRPGFITFYYVRAVFGMQAHKNLAYWAMMSPSTSNTRNKKKKGKKSHQLSRKFQFL